MESILVSVFDDETDTTPAQCVSRDMLSDHSNNIPEQGGHCVTHELDMCVFWVPDDEEETETGIAQCVTHDEFSVQSDYIPCVTHELDMCVFWVPDEEGDK